MARCTKNNPEPLPLPPSTYTLELSEKEAHLLLTLTGRCISGGPTSPIYNALYSALTAIGGDFYTITKGNDHEPIRFQERAKTIPDHLQFTDVERRLSRP